LFSKQTNAEGTKNVPTDEGVVYMYCHASNLDPFVMMVNSPTTPKFVYKKSLLWTIPWIFPLAYLYGHQPIDRTNRDSAIKSLVSAGKKIEKYQRGVCLVF
jgi:1-acyl-sn-glycerol-3-phosphate acyltransferase